ncbi:MAG: hypothetical protein KIT74_06800 [Fimbriimonadales bacterium]|nr:hypothetical protein [Fimbriimonadales bacterium]
MKRSLVVIRGDVTGALGAIWLYWPIFLLSRRRQFGKQYRVSVLVSPSPRQAIEAISKADAVVFYGHGGPGKVHLTPNSNKQNNPTGALDVASVNTVLDIRTELEKEDLDFVMISCCDTLQDPHWIEGWLKVAKSIHGYDGLTYNWKRPFHIPRLRTITR